MFPAASYPIEADRFAPYSDYIDVVGYDFTGATFAMQIRDSRNVGTLRATPTVSVSVATVDGVATSRVLWSIPQATMEAMPTDPSDESADVVLYYDMHITPSGEDEFVAWRGKFTVVAGVTQ